MRPRNFLKRLQSPGHLRSLPERVFEVGRELPQFFHLLRERELFKSFGDEVRLSPTPDKYGQAFLTEEASAADLTETFLRAPDERSEPVTFENEMCSDAGERKKLYACSDETLKCPVHIL